MTGSSKFRSLAGALGAVFLVAGCGGGNPPPRGTLAAAPKLPGLSAPDAYTPKAQLTGPAGFWLTELAMPVATEVVDQKVITAAGEDTWTNSPSPFIGSGPFKLTQRTPKASMDFVPVKSWWGGDTGKLTAIHIEIGLDDVSRVKKFESAGYEVVGMANNGPGPDDVPPYPTPPPQTQFPTPH